MPIIPYFGLGAPKSVEVCLCVFGLINELVYSVKVLTWEFLMWDYWVIIV